MRKTGTILAVLLMALSQSACAPEVGSKKWCENIADKPNGDWTVNEAKAYAKHCVFENYVDEEE